MSDEPAKGTFLTPERSVVLSRSAVYTCGFLILYITDYLHWGKIDPWVIYLWASKNSTNGVTLVQLWAVPFWWSVIAAFFLSAFEAVRHPQRPRTAILALAVLTSAVVLAVMIHRALHVVLYSPAY